MWAMIEKLRIREGSIWYSLFDMRVDVSTRFVRRVYRIDEISAAQRPVNVFGNKGLVIVARCVVLIHQADLDRDAADQFRVASHAGGLIQLVLVVVGY